MKLVFKNCILLLLVAGIAANTLDKLLIIANYEVNKSYIAANLCENKSKPCMHCNGKCYMHKQLKENEKKDSAPQSNNLKEKFQQLFYENKSISLINTVRVFTYSSFINYAPTGKYGAGVFHPPTA